MKLHDRIILLLLLIVLLTVLVHGRLPPPSSKPFVSDCLFTFVAKDEHGSQHFVEVREWSYSGLSYSIEQCAREYLVTNHPLWDTNGFVLINVVKFDVVEK